MPQTLSVAIITYNEEANLARTLTSVRFANEIVIVDSGSTDRTLDIARDFGARVVVEPWKGFAQQKNSAIEKCTSDWVLSLDADEELTPELAQEIVDLLQRESAADAYMLRRRNFFLGRWMRYGGYYPDPKLRLFHRDPKGYTPPRFAERAVHETVAFDGSVATLDHDMIHRAYPTLESYIEHMDRYSTLGAKVALGKGRTSRSLAAFLWNVTLVPYFTFIWNYFFRLGILDGREGLLLHVYHSAYTSWKYAKAWQATRTR